MAVYERASGTGDDDWTNPTNWVTYVYKADTGQFEPINGVPGGADTAVIDNDLLTTSLAASLTFAGSLDFLGGGIDLNGYTFTLTGFADEIEGNLIEGLGTLRVVGSANIGDEVYGTSVEAATIEDAGSMTQDGVVAFIGLEFGPSELLIDSGAIYTITSAAAEINGGPIVNNGTIVIGAGDALNLVGGSSLSLGGTVEGAGVLYISEGLTITTAAAFDVGAVTIEDDLNGYGVLTLGLDLTYAGILTNTGIIDLNGFTLTLTGSSNELYSDIEGPGTLKVTGAADIADGNTETTYVYGSATIEDAGAITQGGTLELVGAGDELLIDAGATYTITSAAAEINGGSIVNNGTIVIGSGDALTFAENDNPGFSLGGTVQGAGTLNIGEDITITSEAATEVSAINVGSGNYSGTLTLGVDLTYGGAFTEQPYSGLDLNGFTLTLTGSSNEIYGNVEGLGTLKVTGAAELADGNPAFVSVYGGATIEDAGAITQGGDLELGQPGDELLIDAGATYTITSATAQIEGGTIDNNGAIVIGSGDSLSVGAPITDAGGQTGSIDIDAGAALTLNDSVLGQTITFEGASGGSEYGALDVSAGGTGFILSAPISGFGGTGGTTATSDTIVVAGSGNTGDQVVWAQDGASGTLYVEDANNDLLDTLLLDGTYNQNQFVLTDPGGTDQITYQVACYCRGTRILTDVGEAAVERLEVGDLVVTSSGERRPIVWIGHRPIDIARHPDPGVVRPVRVAAGAFGEGCPSRDLCLSPGHNLAYGGALLPVSRLINGLSVAQVSVDHVEYWHIELGSHDILLAEGLPAESYLDTGNRTAFINGGAFVEAHPDFKPRHWANTCLPIAFEGACVTAAKTRLLERLAEQGIVIETASDAHLRVDGVRVDPVTRSQWRLEFDIPFGASEVSLCSRVFVPAHTVAASNDIRTLGLCVGKLQVDGELVALSDDALCGPGWRSAEFDEARFTHRWTAGEASVPLGRRIVVDLAGLGYYARSSTMKELAALSA